MDAVEKSAAVTAPGAMPVEEWGHLVIAAKAAGESLGPVWKKFIKTKFFVAFDRSPDDDPKNFLLHVARDADDGSALATIAEVRERLLHDQGDGIIAMSGLDIVLRLEDGGRIEVLLDNAAYSISVKRVQWLLSGIKMTKDRIAIRKRLAEAAPKAPMPVLQRTAETDLAPAPDFKEPIDWAGMLRSRYVVGGALAAAVVAIATTAGVQVQQRQEVASAPVAHEAPVLTPSAMAPRPSEAMPEFNQTFVPADNSFTVRLPGLAEEVELSPDQVSRLGNTRTHQYRLLHNGLMYNIEATDYLEQAPQNPDTEMDVVQEIVVGTDGKLLRAQPITLRGAKGREVRVQLPDGGERAARFVFMGTKYAMVMVTAPKGSATQIDTFLASFALN